ncbi:MAG: alpha/beta hydrolase [Nitrososphaerota archaeon]|nr:alpha/beta hydrolase [Nitrososphaerota archaeon]
MLDYVSHAAPHDVVFVHGAGGNNLLWNRTLQHLSGDSRALAINLPGHPSGAISCTTVAEYAEALHQFLSESGLRAPALCGHSMGGAIALVLAVRHPDDIGGLILASTGAKLGVDKALIEGLGEDPMRAIERVITPWSFNSIELGLGREARTALSVSNLPVFLNDYLACQGFDVRSGLSNIRTDTLVVCGDKDKMTPPKWSHYLNENIVASELYFVKDSGHMLPLEKPESFAGLVQSFLERLR